jgi:hypothetical protein
VKPESAGKGGCFAIDSNKQKLNESLTDEAKAELSEELC